MRAIESSSLDIVTFLIEKGAKMQIENKKGEPFLVAQFIYFLCLALFILPIFPVRGRGVCSMVNRETLSEHRSELRSDALPATTGDFSRI